MSMIYNKKLTQIFHFHEREPWELYRKVGRIGPTPKFFFREIESQFQNFFFLEIECLGTPSFSQSRFWLRGG